ncbi:MAG: C1 family peptidase [Acetobacteraceae bacterium]|nr:C1 family peptidase [Acetobacteraceae bacterium]
MIDVPAREPFAAADLAPEALRARWPVRSQGDAGTCVAHAVASCVELLLALRAGTMPEPLSHEYLYRLIRDPAWPWAAAQKPRSWDKGGVKLEQALAILREHGIASEAEFPDWTDPGLLPAAPTRTRAALRRCDALAYADRPKENERNVAGWPDSPDTPAGWAAAQLANDYPVVLALGAPREDWWGAARTSGRLPEPPADAKPGGDGHAVCLIGLQPDAGDPTRARFTFRNSWSVAWGTAGYGSMSDAYLNAYAWEMLALAPGGGRMSAA